MEKGHVDTSIIKAVIVGAAGAGKSSFASLLFDIILPHFRISTGVIEKAKRVMTTCLRLGMTEALNNQVWEVVGAEELITILADAINASIDFDSTSSAVFVQQKSNNGASKEHGSFDSTSSSTFTDYTVARTTVIKLIGRSKKGRLLKMTWIYIIDSGGQPQFHELLTAFLRNATLGIFVFRLCDQLDDKPQIEYYGEDGKSLGESYPFPMSHKEIFQHCVQTIYSLPSTASAEKGQEAPRPKILVIGTHRDKEGDCSESREQKDRVLRGILNPDPESESSLFSDVIYYGKGCIFPLNARSPNAEDKRVVGKVRSEVEGLAPPHTPIPLQYYALELEIEKRLKDNQQQVISVHDCLNIARSLHFTETAGRAALLHLDSLNLIQYFPSSAEEVIFCDPNVLLNKVNELIKKSYSLRGGVELIADTGGKWIKFHQRGEVTLDILEKFSYGYVPGLYDHHTVAKIFEDLLILTPLDLDLNLYFMPALLDIKNIKDIQRPTKTCLVIAFPSGYAPLGLFSSSVAFLTSTKNKWPSPWKFLYEAGQLFRNAISFKADPVHITYLDLSTHYEVHMETRVKRIATSMRQVVKTGVCKALDESIKVRNISNASYTLAFPCLCDSEVGNEAKKSQGFHLAEINDGLKIWNCKKNPGECGELEPHHVEWLGSHDEEAKAEEGLLTCPTS